MTDGPPRPKSPTRFVTTGCAVVVAIAVVIAALAAFVFWRISIGVDEIAAKGSSWLRMQPILEREFGDVGLERVPASFSVQIRNGQGDAWFDYALTGTKAKGGARIWMVRRDGDWKATGARLSIAGREETIGTVPEPPKAP